VSDYFKLRSIAALAALTFSLAGCATSPHPVARTDSPAGVNSSKPVLLASAVNSVVAAPPATSPTIGPSTRPADIVATLQNMQITRNDLDALLYETYGLQMVFDLVELDLAKNTLLVKQGKKLEPADVERERDIVFSQMFQDAQKSDYEGLFNQFLQKEKIKRAEFEIRAIQTSAVLRKIIEPMVIGKVSDPALRRGYEIMYGANRQIADITVDNPAQAQLAITRLKNGEPWDKVCNDLSIDSETKNTGGLWAPFSAQSKLVPQAIIEAAFTLEVGQVSDQLSDGTRYHVIRVVNVTEPRAQKFDDVKDAVKKQMEDKMIEKDMKEVRQQLQLIAQQQIQFADPVLKAQWDQILARQQQSAVDKKDVQKQMDQHMGPDLKPDLPSHAAGHKPDAIPAAK
jgi:parvulin-like peptidyl-prolyl isomerase